MSFRPRNMMAVLAAGLAGFGMHVSESVMKLAHFENVGRMNRLRGSRSAGRAPQRNGKRKRCVSKSRKVARCKAKRRAHK